MSQFRKDPVSGEWFIIAPERAAKRPHDFKSAKKRIIPPKSKCPFEDLEATGNWPPVLEYDEKGKWQIVVIPNKFPALRHAKVCPEEVGVGPYKKVEGQGYHELLVTRDHRTNFAHLSPSHAMEAFRMFADRYGSIDEDECMAYLSVFGNWGPAAGASLAHPHCQLIALPIIPPDVERSFEASRDYFKKQKSCAHCDMISYERKKKERVLAENDQVIALAPFASRTPYAINIYPKTHISFFEESPEKILSAAASMLQKVLLRMEKRLGDPDNNFFIHTGPLRARGKYEHYHWHIEVVPKISISAGFEIATGVYINPIDPIAAVKHLK